MPEVVRAVGANGGGHPHTTTDSVAALNLRVDGLSTRIDQIGSSQDKNHDATMAKLSALADVIGHPGDGPYGERRPSGIFAHLAAHDRRIRRGEKLWERGVGFGLAAGPLLCALWWLAGDKLAKLLHG